MVTPSSVNATRNDACVCARDAPKSASGVIWTVIGALVVSQPIASASSWGRICVVPASNGFRLRSSVGASILWNSPMGPIRFDYAVVTSKAQQDITQNFRFSGGANF